MPALRTTPPRPRRSARIRTALAATASAAVLLALAGCASDPAATSTTPPSTETTTTPSVEPLDCSGLEGEASDSVEVSAALGSAPDATFEAPLTADATQVTTLTEGSGEPLGENVLAGIQYSLYNGTSGETITTTGFGDEGATQYFGVIGGMLMNGMRDAVGCASVGSRVVAVVPPADAWGETGNSNLGVSGTDSIVFVIDVVGTGGLKADGEVQKQDKNLPTVTLADDGQPTLEIPDADAPSDLQIEVLQQGDGETVQNGDTVTVQYLGVNWTTGEEFDSSWSRGAVSSFPLSGVVEGFAAGLVDQQVGSQVLIVVPPELGYGEQGNGSTIGGEDTIVFVVDILATAPTASAG